MHHTLPCHDNMKQWETHQGERGTKKETAPAQRTQELDDRQSARLHLKMNWMQASPENKPHANRHRETVTPNQHSWAQSSKPEAPKYSRKAKTFVICYLFFSKIATHSKVTKAKPNHHHRRRQGDQGSNQPQERAKPEGQQQNSKRNFNSEQSSY